MTATTLIIDRPSSHSLQAFWLIFASIFDDGKVKASITKVPAKHP
jgi:hypothetical protein